MTFAALLAAALPLLAESPTIVKDVEDLIAAFRSGGTDAMKALLAQKFATDTAALEQLLQTPVR
jgi:hypothetical protein